MKTRSVVFGCVVVVFLLGIAVAAGLYFVWQSDTVQGGIEVAKGGAGFASSLAKLGELSELDRGIESDEAFVAPTDGELTAQQVERFVTVQRRVRDEMDGRLEAAQERFQDVPPEDSMKPLAEALSELASVATEAKRIQVEAVNDAGFSRQEYSWVKRQAYMALGVGDLSSVDLSDAMDAMREGGMEEAMERARQGGERMAPPANVALVEPHREVLEDWAPLALFGF